jgi:trigger factor
VKSSVEVLSPTRVRLDVEVAYSELESHVTNAYAKVATQVSIPGFRKGKVPASMIDQRVGRGTVIDEAINSALPEFYGKAAREHSVAVIGRPEVDVKEFVDNEKLVFTVEVDVRPEVKLPDFSNRVVKTGDFATLDLTAFIDGAEVDGGQANEISYEVGSGKMIDGLDDALVGMAVNEVKQFDTKLVGQQDGEKGEVKVTVKAVKERELPTVDDAFAKLASEFDTLAELKEDFVVRLERVKKMEQGAQARDRLVEKLLAENEIPVPDNLVELEVNDHLEGEGRMEDAEHRAEVDGQVRSSLKSDFLLDAIVQAEDVQITEIELTEYLVRTSQRYGMAPQQFAEELQKAGQIQQLVAEVTRAKALASVLGRITVKDASGNVVDLEALAPKADPADLVEQA